MKRRRLLPAILLVVIPWVLAARDPLDDARVRLAAMTPAQRKSIEQSREKYDRLTSLERLELREFAKALQGLPPNERKELEGVMGRLASWVETFPDDVREKYFASMATDRLTILKEQFVEWKKRERIILAEVNRAEKEAKTIDMPPMNPAMAVKNRLDRIEKPIQKNGTQEEKEVFKLVQNSDRLNPTDKLIVVACLSAKLGFNANVKGKGIGGRREFSLEQVPIALLRSCSFVPAFDRLPDNPRGGLPETNRKELAAVLLQIYLLQPSAAPKSQEQVFTRLEIPKQLWPGPFQHPVHLLQQLALLKDYSEGKKTVPLGDKERVKKILERSK